MIEFPLAWILATIGTLSGAIAALASVMWAFMKSRLAAQDKIIEGQGITIDRLQHDVERMARGCGADHCLWRPR